MEAIKIEFVKTDDLTPAAFNPPERTSEPRLKAILKSMKVDGFWPFQPIVITKSNEIADGHRRWACAKLLGISEVPCLRMTNGKTVDEGWSGINGTKETVNSRQVIEANARGLKTLPDNNAGRKAQTITERYGKEMIDYLYKNGLSFYSVALAERCAKYIGRFDNQEIEKVIRWNVKYKLNRILRMALDAQFSPDLLAYAIDRDEPIAISPKDHIAVSP